MNTLTNEEMIFPDSPESATYETVSGWVSRNRKFYGKDEVRARLDGATHVRCDCGEPIVKNSFTSCKKCRHAKSQENYLKMPQTEFDPSNIHVLFNDDKYFFHVEDIEGYLEDENLSPEELRLCVCEPNTLPEIDDEHWSDVMPEDEHLENVASKEMLEKLEELNKIIRDHKPVSWSQGRYRTTYKRP